MSQRIRIQDEEMMDEEGHDEHQDEVMDLVDEADEVVHLEDEVDEDQEMDEVQV